MTCHCHTQEPDPQGERRPLCTKRAWCIGFEGHEAPCIELPRETHPVPDYGPRRKR